MKNQNKLHFFILNIFLFISIFTTSSYASMDLTKEEKQWLKDNPNIVLGSNNSWPPFVYLDTNKKVAGIDKDIIELINKKLGTNITLVVDNWKTILKEAKDRKIDGLTCSAALEKRKEFFNFTVPYLTIYKYIFTRKNDKLVFNSLDELSGKKVAIQEKVEFDKKLLSKVKDIHIVESYNNTDSIQKLLLGEVDALMGSSEVFQIIQDESISGIKVSYTVKESKLDLVFSIRNDYEQLTSILNKALKSISEKEKEVILTKWLGSLNKSYKIDKSVYNYLSVDEKKWLNKKDSLNVGLFQFQAPVLIKSKNSIDGIVPDYVDLIAHKLNKQTNYKVYKSKNQAIKDLESGVLDTLVLNKTHNNIVSNKNISEKILSMPLVIATRDNEKFLDGLYDKRLKRLAIPKQMPFEDEIKKRYKHIEIIKVKNCLEGLNSLLKNHADAYICSPHVISHVLKTHNLSEIRISGITDFKVEYAFSVTDDNDKLLSILNKSIDFISEDEQLDLKNKWMQIDLEKFADYTYEIRVAIVVFVVVFFIAVLIIIWNRKLYKEIKEKEIAQIAFKESERKLSTLFSNLPGLVYRCKNDSSWTMLEVSPYCFELTEYEDSEIVHNKSIHFSDIVAKNYKKELQRVIDEAVENKTHFSTTYQIITKSGILKWVWEKGIPIYDEDGKLLYLEGLIIDISQQKDIEHKLEDKKIELETIINEIPTPIIIHEEGGKILLLNKAWQNISGYKIDELEGIDDWVDKTQSKDYAVLVKKHIHSLYEITQRIDEGVFKFSNKNDEELVWQFSSAPLGEINGKRRIITAAMDITEMKRKDEMLLTQSRSAAMGEMIGMIAHQWRQPIAGIGMNANNMLMDIALDEVEVKKVEEHCNSILKQTQHLSQTIDDFRNFFKPDKEKVKIYIKDIVNQTIDIVKDSITNNNIELKIDIESDIEVLAYPRELMQVFVNIINNSKDSLVESKNDNQTIDISLYEDEKYINIKISDNGLGIKEDAMPKIFEPYYTTKHESTGTGLGLYMSKMIIEEHLNGKIKAENQTQGVCMIVSLLKTN